MSAPLWTSWDIAKAVCGQASAPFGVGGIAFDSREVKPGDLFIAMRGEFADGHDFVDKAFAAGAAAAIVERPIDRPHVRVRDSMMALEALGEAARKRVTGKVIGVTGSVGKTSTKEALFQALDRMAPGKVHRSVKSYNNHVGVPLSLARMPADSQFAVLEMGMNHAGEISALTAQVRPHVAMVTAIAPAHIGNLGSMEAIADAKAEIFEGLRPGGTAIIPFDSPYVARLYNKADRYAGAVVTFGLSAGADVTATEHVQSEDGYTMVSARVGEAQLCFHLAAPGDHWVSNALAILAAVDAVGGDLAIAALALAELPGMAGRGEKRTARMRDGGAVTIIDESYNANPASMKATLAQLGKARAKRRIAVLGAMKELGEQSDALHAALADPIRAVGVDETILVGDEMAPLASALDGWASFSHVADAQAAIATLRDMIRSGDVVLVKGSNSVGLSRLVAAIADGEQ